MSARRAAMPGSVQTKLVSKETHSRGKRDLLFADF